MPAQAARLHVMPGQGADIDDEHIEGGRLGWQALREVHQSLLLLPIKVIEIGVEVLVGRRGTLVKRSHWAMNR